MLSSLTCNIALSWRAIVQELRAKNRGMRFIALVITAMPAVSSNPMEVGHATGFDVLQAGKGRDLKGLQ